VYSSTAHFKLRSVFKDQPVSHQGSCSHTTKIREYSYMHKFCLCIEFFTVEISKGKDLVSLYVNHCSISNGEWRPAV